MKIFSFLFLFVLSLYANEDLVVEEMQEKEAEVFLKQIVLIEKVESFSEHDKKDSIIIGKELDIPGDANIFKKFLEKFVGQKISKELIEKIEREISSYYKKKERPFVFIAAAEQDLSNGVLCIEVMEGKVAEVTVCGNKYVKTERILKYSRLKKGKHINREQFYSDLSWMNRNPYRLVDGIFSPGKDPGTTDVTYIVKDFFPLRVYLGVDNTGNDFTGNNRLFTGIQAGNLFWADQIFSYQYTTDDEFKRFQAHTLFYSIPLPWKNVLSFFGGYSYVDTKFDVVDINQNRFQNDGYSGQISMRYDIPLRSFAYYNHEVTWGTDWKRMNNAVAFNEVSLDPQTVNLFQLMVRYNLGYDIGIFRMIAEAEGFGNPGKWLPDQKNRDYSSIRPFAKNRYFYLRSLAKFWWFFSRPFLASLQLRGQYSTNNLLPSEQLGIGGAASVRGYKERILNADNGLILNFELQSSPVSIISLFSKNTYSDQFQIIAFFDYGFSNLHRNTAFEEKTENIYSAGPGAKYFFVPYITAQVDWGFQLNHLSGTGPKNRVHFYATIAY